MGFSAPDGRDDLHLTVGELYDWLRRDGELRRVATVSRVTGHAPGTMGALDVIDVVVGQGIAAVNLGVAYATWRAARRTAPGLVVTLPGGTVTVTVIDDGPEALERILAALREASAGPGPDSASAPGPDRAEDGGNGGGSGTA
ncbi:effector-associated constant component EACC1 [Streptomyces erythrochromogenes]|uniref:effector-associated constant component EACC1 n=1 Tax=Streptomyces erythrochromogenes TaxID=285574 RepID=UPI0036A13957